MLNLDFNFTIPYWVFLIPYGIIILLLTIFAVINLFHLLRYAFMSPIAVFTTFLLISGTFFILFISYYFLSGFDWTQELIFKNINIDSFNPL